MKIKITQNVEIPISPYCKNCLRQSRDSAGQKFCTIYNRNIWHVNGQFLKCKECYEALYEELNKNAR